MLYSLDNERTEEIDKKEFEWGCILDDIYVNSRKLVNSYYRTNYFYDEENN